MSQLPLFLLDLTRSPLGPTARRNKRRRFLIGLGYHPLVLIVRDPPLRLHPDHLTNPATRNGRTGGPRCGDCIFYQPLDADGWGQRHFKCWYGSGPRVSRGNATTISAWFPGCADYTPCKRS